MNQAEQTLTAEAEEFWRSYDRDEGFSTYDAMAAFALSKKQEWEREAVRRFIAAVEAGFGFGYEDRQRYMAMLRRVAEEMEAR